MAVVYLAEDRKHSRKVAPKVLRPELATAIGPERFVREIEIAARLSHPHILPLFDSGESDGTLYYLCGESFSIYPAWPVGRPDGWIEPLVLPHGKLTVANKAADMRGRGRMKRGLLHRRDREACSYS